MVCTMKERKTDVIEGKWSGVKNTFHWAINKGLSEDVVYEMSASDT